MRNAVREFLWRIWGAIRQSAYYIGLKRLGKQLPYTGFHKYDVKNVGIRVTNVGKMALAAFETGSGIDPSGAPNAHPLAPGQTIKIEDFETAWKGPNSDTFTQGLSRSLIIERSLSFASYDPSTLKTGNKLGNVEVCSTPVLTYRQ